MYRIGSLDSVIPRAINTKYSLNLKGRKIEILEAGIRLEGVQSLVDKIFGYRGSFDNRNAAEVDQLTRRMNIVNRESDEPSIYANLKVFGREITFVDLYGADIVRGIMNEGMVSLPNIERKLREGYDLTFTKIQPLVMARTIVPTHAGLPLQLHLCGVKVITNKGVVRGSFEPALYQTQRLNIPNSLTLTADIVPRVIVDIVGNMTVKLATFSAGAGITAQLAVEKPIRGSVNIDIATKQLTVDMEPVE
ncbi:PREDICTED: vitellogenin-1-like, partial [Priapulus caudatus]|uniref:Vitellogenin-1-like n=1 Tax=Priapulus caudatus TaxID=37621 RepID=A0ABM1F736_PRICU